MWTQISGRMPASSQASSELSTASLTVVSSALRGLSKPSRWRFLAKNSLTEISRWPGGHRLGRGAALRRLRLLGVAVRLRLIGDGDRLGFFDLGSFLLGRFRGRGTRRLLRGLTFQNLSSVCSRTGAGDANLAKLRRL